MSKYVSFLPFSFGAGAGGGGLCPTFPLGWSFYLTRDQSVNGEVECSGRYRIKPLERKEGEPFWRVYGTITSQSHHTI